MKNVILSAVAASLVTIAPQAADGPRLRYRDPLARVSLTVSHDIEVVRNPPIHARREFSFELSATASADAVTITVDDAKGTNEAHETKQRLGTRHLKGRTVTLSIDHDRRRLVGTDEAEKLAVNLGPVIAEGFPVADVLTDLLPQLPDRDVSVGDTWTTEREVHSLEGWAWTTGTLASRHEVKSVERQGERTVVSVVTEANADFGPVEGGKPCAGKLKRSLEWTFDATNGRLLALSMDQQTEGDTTVPQGTITIRQHSRAEIASL
jgi:hypothetical protein